MSHGLKLLLIAVGALLTCITVLTGVNITQAGKKDTSIAIDQYVDAVEFQDFISDYDGCVISGSDVINLMNKYQDYNIFFLVKTKGCIALEGVYYNRSRDLEEEAGTYDSQKKMKTDEDYINLSASFKCTIYLNDNGVLIGIGFVQK